MESPLLLAGTADGLFKLSGEEERQLAGHTITALSQSGNTWWAILDGREIWKAEDGLPWQRVSEVERLRANCLLATGSGVWIGTSEAHLTRVANGALEWVESFDRIEGREDWFTPWGGPPDTRSLAAGPTGVLFANIHVGGVARSTDQGRTWHPTMDIEVDCHQVLTHPKDASVVLAATAVGLGISTDGGTTWTFEDTGLHATYQRAVAVSGDRVLISTSRSERGQQSAVYRFTLGRRARFEKCQQGLPKWFVDNIDTSCLVARGEFAALGTPDGSVFTSSDLGETWVLLREGLPRIRCLVL